MFKKFIAIILAILVVVGTFCMLGCGNKSDDENTTGELTPEQQVEQSEFLYPDKTEDFRYNKYTYYVKITQCLSLKSNIIIPDTIAGLPVYQIADNAFKNQVTINSVSITDNVFAIGNEAFSGCTNLKEIKLPKKLTILGNNAFANSKLKYIEFPNTLLSIPKNACANCTNLSYVIIDEPDIIDTNKETNEPITTGARTVENGVFSNCVSLKYMWIPEDVTFNDTTLKNVDENIVIYGYTKSAAAELAALNFVDFKLVKSKAELAEFKNKAELASDVISLSGNENYKGSFISLQIEKTFIVREKINYETSYLNDKKDKVTNSFEYIPSDGTNLVVFGVKLTNNSSQKISFNQLNSTIKVDTYLNRFIYLGNIKNSALAKYSMPNYTVLEPDQTAYIYFATGVDDEWEEININFGNFTELLNYNFVIKNDESIIYVGAEGEKTPEPTTEPTDTELEVMPTISSEEKTA